MRKVKWGVLGTAGIARKQTIPGMQLANNCELYAVAGRSVKKTEEFKAEFGFEKAYDSYEALLNDVAVEAVYIPLPNDLHAEWAIRALQAKKHVLCEKPIAVSAQQLETMFLSAEQNNVHLMEAFAYLHSPYVAALKNELDSGIIGDVRYMEATFLTAARGAEDIRLRKETYGGALYDLGCYNTSMVTWLLGEEPSHVEALAEKTEKGIDIHSTALLTYADGKHALLNCGMILNGAYQPRIDMLRIHGTKGTIRSDVQYNQAGQILYTVEVNDQKLSRTVMAKQNYALEVEQLGRCITDGEHPHVSHAFSRMNARVMDRILERIGY